MPLKLAIVGRPNVGKSTLFNRLAGKRLALVDDQPGVTRDWRVAEGRLMGDPILLIDTAGLEDSFDTSIEARMRRQTERALDEADVILFLIDGRAGVLPIDQHFAAWLRRKKKPVLLGINKCENDKATQAAMGEAYALGLGDPVPLSAEHNIGLDLLHEILRPYLEAAEAQDRDDGLDEEADTGALDFDDLDAIEGDEDFDFAARGAAHDEDASGEPETFRPIKIAIVGRPNAGKSTLLNAIVREERVMTGPEAGITRDAISVEWEYQGRPFRLVDTAGLRRKARITAKLEQMAVSDTLRAIRLAQVVVLVLDATLSLEKQDLTIAEHVLSEGRALVLAINKWDSVDEKNETLQKFKDRMERSLAQVPDVPVVTLSALHGKNVERVMDSVLRVYETWNKRLPTGQLNRWIAYMESHHPPPLAQGRPNRLKYITQIKSRPPTFVLWASRPDELPQSYVRYLINGLRADYDMPGVPVRLLVRTSKNPYV